MNFSEVDLSTREEKNPAEVECGTHPLLIKAARSPLDLAVHLPVGSVVAAAAPVLAEAVMAGTWGSWDGVLPAPSAGQGWRHCCWRGASLDLET